PLTRDHRGAAEVVGLDRLVVKRDPARNALTVRHARTGVAGADRRIGARPELDRAGRVVGYPEGDTARVGQPYRRRRDLAEDLVRIERRGDELDELDHRPNLTRPRLPAPPPGAPTAVPAPGRALPYRTPRGGLGAAGMRLRESTPTRPDRGPRPAAHMIVRTNTATPSGTVAAGPRGCAPRLFASS